jgi:hypothetical protein
MSGKAWLTEQEIQILHIAEGFKRVVRNHFHENYPKGSVRKAEKSELGIEACKSEQRGIKHTAIRDEQCDFRRWPGR